MTAEWIGRDISKRYAPDGTDTTSIEVVLSETDKDEVAPTITSASSFDVNEGTSAVATLTADEAVTWSITGGVDAGDLSIDSNSGALSFDVAPDYEAPADDDGNNSYVIEVTATDAAGNTRVQTVTVNVLNSDTPSIMVEGTIVTSGQASFEVLEGTFEVATFSSDENVAWDIVSGDDRGQFSLGGDGQLVFNAEPDFESPVDTDKDNVYILAIEATDESGKLTRLYLDVTVLDREELQDRVNQIGDALRRGLRTHALIGLSDLISYNENLLTDVGTGDECAVAQNSRDISGALEANENSQVAEVRFNDALTQCGRGLRVLLDAGASFTRLDGNSRVRGFGSMRIEKNVSSEAQLGFSLIGSTASDSINKFAKSVVSDMSLTGQVYGRIRIDDDLIAGAFAGYGGGWYNFNLVEDGLALQGDIYGERLIAGGMMRGEMTINRRPLTIDAVFSHAKESLGNARIAAAYETETAEGILLDLGHVQQSRISIPITYSAFGPVNASANGIGLDLRAGGLCESDIVGEGIDCGFQAGGRLWRRTPNGHFAYLDIDFESAAGLSRVRLDAGYAFDIGLGDNLALAINASTLAAGAGPGDYAGFVSLTARR